MLRQVRVSWILSKAIMVLSLQLHFLLMDRHIVSGSCDKTVRVWDAQTGQNVIDPLKGHDDSVTSVAFSPDGRHIVSGSGTRQSECGMLRQIRQLWISLQCLVFPPVLLQAILLYYQSLSYILKMGTLPGLTSMEPFFVIPMIYHC
jgi:WD40 repeat protein